MRFILALLSFLMVALLVVTGSFVWFVQSMPSDPLADDTEVEAIVVLTGGNGRVEKGLIELAQGDAPILFISGVGDRTTRRQMLLAHATPDTRARIAERDPEIVFDYVASTTRSNADQAAKFLRERDIHSIRLITAYYHMPRSMLEFRTQLPGVLILPDPVFPEGYRQHSWWQDKATRRLIIKEYGKYFAALFLRTRFVQ